MTSQGISEDIKQQLAKKEAEKEQKEKKIEELVEERKKLETNLRKAKQEERPDIEASIARIEKDVDSLRAQLPALNEQIRLLLGECDFFFFFLARLRNSIHLFRLSFLPSLPTKSEPSSSHTAIPIYNISSSKRPCCSGDVRPGGLCLGWITENQRHHHSVTSS